MLRAALALTVLSAFLVAASPAAPVRYVFPTPGVV